MNGQHVLFRPEPVRACPPPPAIREQLARLRAEFAAQAARLLAEAPMVFVRGGTR